MEMSRRHAFGDMRTEGRQDKPLQLSGNPAGGGQKYDVAPLLDPVAVYHLLEEIPSRGPNFDNSRWIERRTAAWRE